MESSKFAQEIGKTGYVLESRVSETLRRSNWTVISNKYYEDDFDGKVREFDLLAYKVTKAQHLDVYTTLLISCKKSAENVWALLARNINLKDPNSNWWPLHAWSNDKAIMFEMAKPSMKRTYHEDLIKDGVEEALSLPNVEVFAFQEMNRESAAPKNDTAIFNSITSLIKAQAYELGALSHRKKTPSVYQFNLISVVDTDLIRLKIEGEDITEESIDSEHYISRYIVKRNETFSRIRFVKASSFDEKLKDYTRLHEANCRWFDRTCNTFYDGIIKDWNRLNVYVEDFRQKVGWNISWAARQAFNTSINTTGIFVSWNAEKGIAIVELVDGTENIIDNLNQNIELKSSVGKALKEIYRYSGEFQFALSDIPF